MHFEEPHAAPAGWRAFLRQYAMIVLSILTALALERLAVGWSDHVRARDSRARIEAELAHDLAEVRQSEQSNAASLENARAVSKAVFALLRAGKQNDAAMLEAARPMANALAISGPTWQRTAWDSALADQSVAHLPQADLARYAAIYATEKDMEQTEQVLVSGDWLSRAAEVMMDTQLGQLDGRRALELLARYMLALRNIDAGERDLITLMTAHAAEPKGAAGGH